MAYCANCGHQISDDAPYCPQCGQARVTSNAALYADFGSRFLARIIDWLILIIPGIVLSIVFAAIQFGSGAFGDNRFSANPFNFSGAVITFAYHWLMLALWEGQTVGKRVMHIRILRADGSPLDLGTSAARAAMSILSGLVLGLGFFWALWDPERRTWHDMVADTRAFRAD